MDPQVTIGSTKHGLVLDDLGSPILGNLYIIIPSLKSHSFHQRRNLGATQ